MKIRNMIIAAAAAAFCGCSQSGEVVNIALNRAARATSSYDYNLTAQLVTDGIVEKTEPAFVKVSTASGELPRRESLWTIDAGPYSFNRLEGNGDFLEYEWSTQRFSAGCVRVRGHLAYQLSAGGETLKSVGEGTAKSADGTLKPDGSGTAKSAGGKSARPSGGWSVKCYAGAEGGEMKLVGTAGGDGLPGTRRDRNEVVTDPNKQTETISLPTRGLDFEIPLADAVNFSRFRIEFDMPGAVLWAVKSVDFTEDAHFGKNRDTGPYDSKESRGFSVLSSEVFSSAWMSADGSPQRICIDLGSRRRFDAVRLHWIHKAERGCVEISDDGENWKKAAVLPKTDSLEYAFKASGKARYVRLSMEGADESGRFVLSEMEILGPESGSGIKSGSCTESGRCEEQGKAAQPGGCEKSCRGAAESGWKLRRASEAAGSGEEISTAGYDDSEWLPAVVPGTVLYSYIAAGAVPDPGIADNNLQISESYFNSDFWYRWTPDGRTVAKLLKDAASRDGGRVILSFDGINWKAGVYVNGKFVGDIAGAFKRARFDVTDLLKGDGDAVAVRIVKNAHYGAAKEKNAESPDFNGGQLGADNPTFHATIGWDWMPTVRGRDIGIWNDVRLETVEAVRLDDPLVRSRIGEDGCASMAVTVRLGDISERDVSGTLRGTLGDIAFEKRISLRAGESRQETFTPEAYPQLKNREIALWWPNGYGEPALHDASFTFTPDGADRAAASVGWRAGIREFTYRDAGSSLKMYINGHRFFPKGGNWGFSEYNLRYGAREYDRAVRMHRDMNLNMIRDWVGQTGDEEFYEACDKYGVVVWQDFWLANPADGPDPDDAGMFLDNARDYLSLIRRHPSIGLYCGRNEGYPPAAINAGLEKAVKTLHPDILYIPNSAADGVSGHGPYRAVEPAYYFEKPTAKFHSERGMPAVMDYASLSEMLGKDHLWPFDDVWGQHDFTKTGAQGDAAFVELVCRRFGEQALESAEKFAGYAQWINYDGYRAMYEANNVNRYGLLIWMSHSAWPSLAWQTYDYWFRPTAACAAVRKACEPVHIQLNSATCAVEVVNASRGDLKNLNAGVSVVSPAGEPLYSKTASVSPAEDTTTQVIDMQDVPDGLCIVTLTLTTADGKVLSENRYFRNFRSGKDSGDYRALVGTKWLDSSFFDFQQK